MHLLAGRYILVKQIGKGGFGAVEEYTDDITKENVAIKTIPSRYVNQESRRLVREIDIMCFLHEAHPHVIGYFSIFATRGTAVPNHSGGAKGTDDPLASVAQTAENTAVELNVLGEHYAGLSEEGRLQLHHQELMAAVARLTKNDEFNVHIVMPLMKGDLFYFIRLLSSQSSVQRLGVTHQFLAQVAVVFAFQICFGLDYLHQCGIIHRDMKPDNVLVRLDITNPYMSTALIADMGLARDAQQSDTIYICTRYYRPPEVITSVSAGSSRIDIWSLGCIFYEICTGQTLFTMRTALNERGEWDGAKASLQLEVILNTVGTPAAEDIDRYMPAGNAKLYLQRSAVRPSQLRQLIDSNWILHTSGDEKEKWIDLITRCVAFFPEQRPTAQQLCQHQLFRDYNVFYGSNVQQYAPMPYTPSYCGSSDTSRSENKAAILALVQRALQETTPQMNEESSEDDDEDEVSSSGSGGSGSASSGSHSSDAESDGEADENTQPLSSFKDSRSAAEQADSVSNLYSLSLPRDARQSRQPSAPPPHRQQQQQQPQRYRDHNRNEETDRVTTSLSAYDTASMRSGTSAVGSPRQERQPQPPQSLPSYALPPLNASAVKDYAPRAFLDDDDEDGSAGVDGVMDHDTALLSEPRHDADDEEQYSDLRQQQRPSVFTPRYSPGNVFRQSPAALPPPGNGAAPAVTAVSGLAGAFLTAAPTSGETDRRLGHSVSSEESGPVVEDTPPLAPSVAFRDRITRRRQSGAEEELEPPKLGAQRPSAFDLNNYRAGRSRDAAANEEAPLPESIVPSIVPRAGGSTSGDEMARLMATYNIAIDGSTARVPLSRVQSVPPSVMATASVTASSASDPYQYLSQYHLGVGAPTAVNTHAAPITTLPPVQPQLQSFYGSGWSGEGSSRMSSMRIQRGGSARHRIPDAGVRAGSTAPTTTVAVPASAAGGAAGGAGREDEYDYLADTEYYLHTASSNMAQSLAARRVGEKRGGSPLTVNVLDSDRGDVPLLASSNSSAVAALPRDAVRVPQPPPPSHKRAAHDEAAFPPITNVELRHRYMAYRHTPRSIQAATSSVLEELGNCTHDAERSSELRELLNYFTSLQATAPLYTI